MRMRWRAGTWLLASALAMPALAQPPATEAKVLILDFKAEVQVDGSLAKVEPDASLLPMLQSMLRKQVAGWRYTPGAWQGKPVPTPVSQRIVAELLPVASGGFAARIKDVVKVPMVLVDGQAPDGARMYPPRYPEQAMRQGIEATLVYAMRRDAQGGPIEVELVDAQVTSAWRKQFDMVSRQAIEKWHLQSVLVEGQAIDCRLLAPVTFQLSTDRAPPPKLEPDLRPYLSRIPDACPLTPILETKAVGTFL